MYRKFYSSLVAALAFTTVAFAQTPERSCASMEVLDRQLSQDPSFSKRLEQLESFTRNFEQNQAGQRVSSVITIPVVVHVVYNTAAQNVSTTLIQNQLDVLNEDFRKLNADASNVPSVWSGIAADCQIQFCL